MLGIAGLLGAKEKNVPAKSKIVNKIHVKKAKSKAPKEFMCRTFKTSCGWTSGAYGNSFEELLINMWESDNLICG